MVSSVASAAICTLLCTILPGGLAEMRYVSHDVTDVGKDRFPKDDFIVWLGHSSFLIKLKGVIFYTDPVIFDRVVVIKRQTPFPFDREELPAPEFILISHNHFDHMDIPSIRFLLEKAHREGKKIHVFVPKGASRYLKNENSINVELMWNSEYDIKGLKIKAMKVKHFSGRGIFDWNASLWNAYVVLSDRFRIFFQGDTAYIRMPRLEPDIALMPIGAWKPRWFMKRNHVSPCEAVQMAHELGAKLMIPMHYGTFKLGMDTSEESIEQMMRCSELFGVKFLIPKQGEVLILDKIL